MVLAAAGIVLIPGAPLGLITTSVQALAGVLLPSATVFLLLLCNDREVLGPWTNAPWLNVVASVIVGMLVELSLILMVSTVFPKVDVTKLFIDLSIVLIASLAIAGAFVLRSRRGAAAVEVLRAPEEKRSWTMPPLALLERPKFSPGRRTAMLMLRGYLVVAVLLLVVKTVQLGH
jgi:hypothetical protein